MHTLHNLSLFLLLVEHRATTVCLHPFSTPLHGVTLGCFPFQADSRKLIHGIPHLCLFPLRVSVLRVCPIHHHFHEHTGMFSEYYQKINCGRKVENTELNMKYIFAYSLAKVMTISRIICTPVHGTRNISEGILQV